jgi:CubicO group peptidase (beta-lactamase class C family)
MTSTKIHASRLVLLLVTVFAQGTARSAEPIEQGLPGLEAFVDDIVHTGMEKRKAAGLQLAIVKDGQTALLKGYGIDSVTPLRDVDPRRSLFRIGSISKTFTWMSILQLAERGSIRLDGEINAYLPDGLKIPDEGFRQPIRVIDLMNHAAGFEETFGEPFVFTDSALYPHDDYLRRYRPHRVREPGVVVSYSNYGTTLAGAIVEHVSGLDFETYVERNLLEPLGLSRTTFRYAYDRKLKPTGISAPMAPNLLPDRAQGIEWSRGRWMPFPQEHNLRSAAGGAISTASDMAQWMLALLEPDRLQQAGVITRDTFALLATDSFPSAPMAGLRHGFMRAQIGYDNLSHAGGAPHFISYLIVIPDLRLGIFASTNSITGGAVVNELHKRILARYFPAQRTPPPPPSPEQAAGGVQDISGWYRDVARSYTTIEKIIAFQAAFRIDVDERGDVIARGAGGSQKLVRTGADQFTDPNAGTSIQFARIGDKVYLRQFVRTAERIPFHETPRWFFIAAAVAALACCGVLVAAFKRRDKVVPQSRAERVAAVWLTLAAVIWLVSLVVFGVWLADSSRATDPIAFMLSFPQPSLQVARGGILLGAVITVIALVMLYPVWRMASWSRWRRIGHTAAVLAMLVLVGTLHIWNLIGLAWT